MFVIVLRTDKPEAEIGLFDDAKQLVYETWAAHRQLAETIHKQITKNLKNVGYDWTDISGVVAYKGPGSFTGLRIGLSVANALAYGLQIPIVATQGNNWVKDGLKRLVNWENDQITIPAYGSPAHITLPKK